MSHEGLYGCAVTLTSSSCASSWIFRAITIQPSTAGERKYGQGWGSGYQETGKAGFALTGRTTLWCAGGHLLVCQLIVFRGLRCTTTAPKAQKWQTCSLVFSCPFARVGPRFQNPHGRGHEGQDDGARWGPTHRLESRGPCACPCRRRQAVLPLPC